MLIIAENLQKMYFKKQNWWKILKNVEKCWMLEILTQMLKCWKMLIQKLNFLTQIIFW